MQCIGKQPTLEEMRAEKAEKFKELKSNVTAESLKGGFLRYVPLQLDESREDSSKSKEVTPSKKTVKKKPKQKRQTSLLRQVKKAMV